MTKDGKQILYNLIKTSACAYSGYTISPFDTDEPQFEDDVIEFEGGVQNAEADAPVATKIAVDVTEFESGVPGTESVSLDKKLDATDATPKYNVPPLSMPTSMPKIAVQIEECRACPLCEGRTNTVPGMGVAHPYVLVVGEGPGHDEDVSGLPFVGAAGKLLDKMLIAIQLDRNVNCYIANVVKCRPPNNRTPTYEEAAACGGFLRSQIDVLKPKMILAAGRTAAQYLLETDAPLGKLRGTFYNYHASYGNIPLLVTYHPSALLRDESNKRPAWEDLKMFQAHLLEIAPNYAELIR